MVTIEALTIGIPLLFIILIQLITVTRGTTVLTDMKSREYYPPGDKPTVEYEPFPKHRIAHWMADLLPTLGRWGTGIGVFGLLHLLTTSYLLMVTVGLGYIASTDNRAALIGVFGLVIVWFLLPFLEVEEYDELTQRNLRPKSLDYHVIAVAFELFLIMLTIFLSGFAAQNLPSELSIVGYRLLTNFASSMALVIGFAGGYGVLHYHNLIYNPTFVIMLSQEVASLENSN